MLGENIRRLRAGKGISQVELADALGVTKQSVSNWENNNIQPSIDMLLKLAGFFSVSTDRLLGLDDRRFLEVTGLSDEKLRHIQQIIDDMRG